MDKVHAMVLKSFNEPFECMEFDKPVPKNDEVLVKIAGCGICGSDIHIWKGEDKRAHLPMILGHEGVGFIESLSGSSKQDIFGNALQEGDLIVWNRGVSCKKCYTCLIKRQNYLCPGRWSYGFSKSIHDYPYLNGSYSSHILLTPETEIIRVKPLENIDPNEDYSVYASLCCAGTTTACVFEQARLQSGDQVVIQGPGPLGIYAVLFARECGAKSIIVIGGTENRLNLCLEAGATHIINRKNTSFEQRRALVTEATEGRGADAVLEFAGTSSAVEEGIQYLAYGGAYISAGIAVDVGQVSINWFRDVGRRNARIQGVWVGDSKNTWQALEVFTRYKPMLEKMVTHKIPLEKANDALMMVERKEAIKAVLIP
ncbi:MAG: zinc-binding dehydrogenase [Treponema sp.]|nr:zinc-binding dehydrogenase [Treponema sp.]